MPNYTKQKHPSCKQVTCSFIKLYTEKCESKAFFVFHKKLWSAIQKVLWFSPEITKVLVFADCNREKVRINGDHCKSNQQWRILHLRLRTISQFKKNFPLPLLKVKQASKKACQTSKSNKLACQTSKHIWNEAMWYISLNVRVVIPILDKLKEIWNFSWMNTIL